MEKQEEVGSLISLMEEMHAWTHKKMSNPALQHVWWEGENTMFVVPEGAKAQVHSPANGQFISTGGGGAGGGEGGSGGSIKNGEALPKGFLEGATKSVGVKTSGVFENPPQRSVTMPNGSHYLTTKVQATDSVMAGSHSAQEIGNNMHRTAAIAEALGFKHGEGASPVGTLHTDKGTVAVTEWHPADKTLNSPEGQAQAKAMSAADTTKHLAFEYLSGMGARSLGANTYMHNGLPEHINTHYGMTEGNSKTASALQHDVTKGALYKASDASHKAVDWQAIGAITRAAPKVLAAAKKYSSASEYKALAGRMQRLSDLYKHQNTHAQQMKDWTWKDMSSQLSKPLGSFGSMFGTHVETF